MYSTTVPMRDDDTGELVNVTISAHDDPDRMVLSLDGDELTIPAKHWFALENLFAIASRGAECPS